MTTPPTPPQPVAELWRSFSAPLRGYLRRRTRSAADADDLLQEVFVRIHRQIPTLRDASKLQGWVYRIARNAVIDHSRARRVRPGVPLEPAAVADAAEPAGRDVIDLTPTLRRFVADLPPAYREVIVRHEFQGQPLPEIAAALGLTLTATKSRVRRGRMLLRGMLDRCCRFEFDRRGRVIAATPRAPLRCRCEP
jgi:RNA polymerase sigma-70 factor (ECF subfamily)